MADNIANINIVAGISGSVSTVASNINETPYELGTTAAVSSHTGIITGHIIRTNYFDSARTSGSGAEHRFTNTTTLGKAGNWPDADGYFYDADGKQFESLTQNADRNADQWGGTFLPTLSNMRSGGEFNLLNAFSKTVAAELAAGTNTDDQSDIINEVLSDAVSIHIGPSLIYCGDLIAQSHSKITGSGYGSYSVNARGNTTLLGFTGKTRIFDITGTNNVQLLDLTIDGRSSTIIGVGASAAAEHFEATRVKFLSCSSGIIGNGVDLLSMRAMGCVFRQGGNGVYNIQDSEIIGCTFSGNTRGMYITGGQIQILDSFFEFHRNGTLSGDAIELIGNANEISIVGNKFDRNAGHDIKAITSGGNYPSEITITGNQFKGAAWATDISSSFKVAIFGQSGCYDNSIISGNYFQQRSHDPSTIEGVLSPLSAIYAPGATNLVLGPNSYNTPNYIDGTLTGWVASTSGTNEYYYAKVGGPDLNEPNFLYDGTTVLAAGTAGALAADQWDWADNDSLGYNTMYVRLTSGGDPDAAAIKIMWTVFHTDDNFHLFPGGSNATIANGATATFNIKIDLTPTNAGRGVIIEIYGDETNTTSTFYYEFNIVTNRGTGNAGIDEGAIIDRKAGLTSRGWTSGGGLEDLTVGVTSQFAGQLLAIAVTNNGGNSLRVNVKVPRN